ncbi:GLUG motif-containing protein [Burkholderia cepacia]|uniref:GLUG motif-containing protein n=1 Tax=Burkholderia cepacia TaxID=292 RepID=UPI0020187222|nr:GLUG motif-containing protein [Burkholderia cepacia]UQO32892.1 filamentous hemagglutinin N-terminal domain-containing protein [Burkholderia cepacia]UQO46387.1 filamentous hemagglutinin N-terminal domain-containing protein [Burkholderia cepacia]UQP11468.1 filamentous hemagglutinin N-terminal domain-containing protein [Burkholderia cepacia]
MNKAYSLVWNEAQGGWCAVSETARRRGKTGGGKRLLAAGVSLLGLAATSAYALPTGGAVASGKADIATSADGKTMSINQHTDKLITNWQDFSVAGGERVSFQQPGIKSIALNRVIGTNGSQIHGQIDANGKVFVVNPNGVVFGAGAQVNVGGLVASTKNISDGDFLASNYRFSGASGQSVENAGTITATEGGSVALLGARVSNTGVIRAQAGRVALGAGDTFTVNFDGNGLLNLQVEGGAMDAQAHNGGLLSAEGGEVLMTARAANGLLNAVVNNSGTIEAQGLKERAGKIVLDGGLVQVAGKLNAAGGEVTTRGEQVKVSSDTQVDTRSTSGHTGTWTIESANANIDGANAAIGAATLSRALGTTNVALTNTSSDLTVDGALNWASDHTLALTSQKGDVALKRAMTASGAKASVKATAASEILIDDKLALTGDQAHLELNSTKGHRFTQDKATATLSGRNASFSSNGEGYQVIHDVAGLRNVDRDLKGRYVLGNAIDGKGAAFQSIGANSAFDGVFDGLGNTVSRLSVTGVAPSVGLFSENNGRIANLALASLTVTNPANAVNSQAGSLAGTNRGTISNVRATGMTVTSTSSVRGNSLVGGLVGLNEGGAIDGARFQGRINGNDKAMSIGGIAGQNIAGARIANSRADAEITGKGALALGMYTLGGLVGTNSESTVSNSSSSGKLSTGDNAIAGGLVGFSDGGAIDRSTSSMAVSVGKNAFVGGAVGWNAGSDLSNVSVSGSVSATSGARIGGLVGHNSGAIRDASASGNVSATSGAEIGGLVGSNEGTIRNASANGTVTSTAGSTIGGLVGSNDSGAISESHASGNVSGNGAAAVGGFVGKNAGGVFTDVSAKGRVTDAASQFVGGLVGVNTGTIRLAAAAGDVSAGNASKVGGLVGVNDGKIDDSRSSGTVRGGRNNSIGGLVGENNGTIGLSSSTSNVSAGTDSYVGGLVGDNKKISAEVSGSKAFGNVTATNGVSVGGFVGWNNASIVDSESSGTVTGIYTKGGGFAGGNTGVIRSSSTSSKSEYPAGRQGMSGDFVGLNAGRITSSETTGAAAGNRFVGFNLGMIEAKP